MTQTKIKKVLSGKDLWELYLPAAFFTVCYAWWRLISPLYIGRALAAAGVAAMVVIVRAGRASRGERRLWIAFCVLLLCVEGRVAYKAHDQAKSYLICHFSGDKAFVDVHGAEGIHSASMHIVDQFQLDSFLALRRENGDEYDRLYQHIPLGDFPVNSKKIVCVKPMQSHGGVSHYAIVFSAQNGEWWEYVQTKRVGQKLLQAYRVTRVRGSHPEVLYEYADKEYPLEAGQAADWSWIDKN